MAKKSSRPSQTTSLILPDELHKKLDDAAQKSGARGIGAEIRRRLEASFEQETPLDRLIGAYDVTPDLADGIFYLSKLVQDCYGDWTKDRFAFDVLKACIDKMLAQKYGSRIKGEAKPVPTPMAEIILGEGEHLKSIDDISRVFVAIWLSGQSARQAELEKKYGSWSDLEKGK